MLDGKQVCDQAQRVQNTEQVQVAQAWKHLHARLLPAVYRWWNADPGGNLSQKLIWLLNLMSALTLLLCPTPHSWRTSPEHNLLQTLVLVELVKLSGCKRVSPSHPCNQPLPNLLHTRRPTHSRISMYMNSICACTAGCLQAHENASARLNQQMQE